MTRRTWPTRGRLGLAALTFAAFTVGCAEPRLTPAPLTDAPGVVRVVDAGGPHGDTGYWPSLALGPDGRPLLAYCDLGRGDVRLARPLGSGFHIETIAGQGRVGKYVALALGAAARPGVLFYDQDQKLLHYAEQLAPGRWATERVARGLEVGIGAQLTYDESGEAHAFFYVPSGTLVHARRPALRRRGDWPRQSVAAAGGALHSRFGVGRHAGRFWLAFTDWDFERSRLLLARPRGQSFAVQTVAVPVEMGLRVALASAGAIPRIVAQTHAGALVMLEESPAGRWQPTPLVGRAGNFAAAAAPSGELVIAYATVSDTGAGGVELLRRSPDGQVRRSLLESDGPAGDHLTLAVDARGRAVVAYHARSIRGLKLYDETAAPTP